ncbi:hypothetical protein J40TS1_43660 [Paenibacillus montaniterrae]|uniref:Metal ABC transporter permease n=1 Tax=Paenibacillus montaniterrae TaxID=429341 RepID=A0A919YV80_9BACL|nr:metal ABC transporter permease [Paenibacillus montaniterrae]GIP18724.1 hypothetical protein J40TS1_43660 [Paenibacillus montaniterrae]
MNLLSYNAQWVLLSTLLLGMAAGSVGVLAYWKRQSLMSDTLSHAALPGVVIGFMIMGSKQLPVMLLAAAVSAYFGAWLVQSIRNSSRVKEDAAMGIVLSVFFGLGIMLLTFANRMPGGGQSGLDHFIFGQAAAMVRSDVTWMAIVAAVVLVVILLLFKEWKVSLFDASFAQGLGLSVRAMNSLYTALLVLVIVIGIQAVGVILIAALMIIPAVSARYWTDSFAKMLILSALFGGGAGLIGTLISTLGKGLPTGPFIVVSASAMFFISLLFGASKGLLVVRYYRKRAKGSGQKAIMAGGVTEGGRG